MIYPVHRATRETPAENEYSAPVRCLNCETLYDADDHADELTAVGCDANGQMQYVCDECKPGFTCVQCEETTLSIIRKPGEDPICHDCQRELDGAEVA